MQVQVLQMRCVPGDRQANLQQIAAAAQRAGAQGSQLLLAPELCITGYGAEQALRATTQAHTEGEIAQLQALARAHGVAIVAGLAERSGTALYNSAVFVRPGEAAPVVYRKTCLFGAYEHGLFVAGAPSTCIVEWGGLRIGLLICYDLEFPENARRLARAGAQLLAVPTALAAGAYSPFIASQLVPVRAFENQMFVAYANYAGDDGRYAYAGLSCVAAPDGQRLAHGDALHAQDMVARVLPEQYQDCMQSNAYLASLETQLGPVRS